MFFTSRDFVTDELRRGIYAVIVPFRASDPSDPRMEHLARFRQFISTLVHPPAKLYVIDQVPGRKFNRGTLLNVGFLQAYREIPGLTHVITHDVDLIPSSDLGDLYACVPRIGRPIHFARRFSRYAGDHSTNPEYIGGVVSFTVDDFLRIDGYPNKFWGWGGEDDELSRRIRVSGMDPVAPSFGSYTDLEGLTLKQKVNVLRTGTARCTIKHELLGEYSEGKVCDGVSSLSGSLVRGVSRTDESNYSKITLELFASSGHPSDVCSSEGYSVWGYS